MSITPNHSRLVAVALAAMIVFGAVAPAAMAADAGIREEIKGLSDDVKKKRQELELLQKKEDRYRQLIGQKKAESASLEDEIGMIDNRIAKAQLDIDIARQEIKSLELQMQLTDTDIRAREVRMESERDMLAGLARKLQRSGFRKSAFEILLAHRSLASYFDEIGNVARLQAGVNRSLARLKETKSALESERAAQESRRITMEERKRGVETAQRELEDRRLLKDSILLETKSSELEYRYLLAELQQEQNEADSEIQYLERSLRDKIDVADRLKGEDSVLSWPLVPARGLSTRFHDPEYPFRYVFEHPGIDIRAGQGTAVRASAAGIVARAKSNGLEYSYIMLIHNGELSTVYGHLSKITVKEDTFVERGEIIGYSGGMPGTTGAGRMTTGPHLHYETRLRGIPVDPLNYLVSF